MAPHAPRCVDCFGPVLLIHGDGRPTFSCPSCRLAMTEEEARAAAQRFAPLARAEAARRVQEALDRIQRAQAELERASAALSSLEGGVSVWRLLGRLHDRVHAAWYRVETFRKSGRFVLDGVASDALAKRLQAERRPTP